MTATPMTSVLHTHNSDLLAYPGFVRERFSESPEQLWTQLNQLPLQDRPEIIVHGRKVRQNREVSFFSDAEIVGYRYSGQIMPVQPLGIHPCLRRFLRRVNRVLGTRFNAILVNRYRDGTQSIGAHSDDLRDLCPTHPIASVSLGATRTFRIRNKTSKAIVLDYPHRSGTLLSMTGEFQTHLTHEIPKQLRIGDSRISLTFRCHLA